VPVSNSVSICYQLPKTALKAPPIGRSLLMIRTTQRKIVKLARLPTKLVRADLERRGPMRREKFRDLTGRKFKRCTVIGLAGFIGTYSVWLCRCSCGALFLARANVLPSRAMGCGCGGGKHQRHGDTYSVEYATWTHMKNNHPKEVCDRWQSYRNFLKDLGRRPGTRFALDRIDKSRPFEPGNVRWLPDAEARPRRRSIFITYKGRTLNISGWARQLGISHQAMNKRVQRCKRYGAPLTEALTTPAGQFMPTAYQRLARPNQRG
jgi:hypothetical protein